VPLVERNVLPPIGLEVAGFGGLVHPAAVLAHELAADSAAAKLRLDRHRAEVGMGLPGIALAPGGEPPADPDRGPGPTAIMAGRHRSRSRISGWQGARGRDASDADQDLAVERGQRPLGAEDPEQGANIRSSDRRRRSGSSP
jgi:hypothetical protein